MRNATPVLLFKMRRPTRRHNFLRVNFLPFSFFTRTTRAKINPGDNVVLTKYHTLRICTVKGPDMSGKYSRVANLEAT